MGPEALEAPPLAENPLLPDEQLRALLAHTRHCAKLGAAAHRASARKGQTRGTLRRGSAAGPGSREALLAATTLQLGSGDLLVPETGDKVAALLAPAKEGAVNAAGPLLPELERGSSRLLLGTAMAAALKATGSDRLVLTYTRAGAIEPGWAAALRWGQTRLLPLVLVCSDARGPEAFRPSPPSPEEAFTWERVRALARKLQLPVLSVDGEDAVAVYRAMQESVLRARAGGGPAVLWAMLPTSRELAAGRPAAVAPVRRLERYLRARKIPLR